MENLERSDNKNVSLSLIAEYASESESEDTQSNENAGNDDSDVIELSEMVLKNNIINACAHGPLSANSESNETVTRHMIIDSIENEVVEYDVTEYRDADSESESSSDDSSDSEVDSVKDIDDNSSSDEVNIDKLKPPKVRDELGLDDLPPIEDLAISLPAQETTKIGTIISIVDRLVIVRAFPETPAIDLESVLFLENGAKTLGKVYDVIGPVVDPHYCVRFNSQEHIKERAIEPGMEVFIAPRSQHTSYVFLSELMKVKGSDASWLHDKEPPPSQVDYSDDEEERRARNLRKEQNKLAKQSNEEGETSRNQTSKKVDSKRNQSSSRGSSRGRFLPQRFKRHYPTALFRSARPWDNQAMRTPPPHFINDSGENIFIPPPFNPHVMPPFHTRPNRMNRFQFGRSSRVQVMSPIAFPNPFRGNAPVFGGNFCNMSGPLPRWMNEPPPPGI